MLSITNLTKKYGTKLALDNISFKIEPGQICAFIGKNGAGKTTAIKCLTGIIDFENGEIFINGKNLKNQDLECKHDIAYIPDNPDLYEFMTGIAYLNFICDVFNVSKEDRKRDIENYASILEISSALPSLISSYSHGMKQKLAIIAALVHNPKLLVLDEPFVGLDPNSTHQLKQIMKSLVKNGASVFFSTHILEVAEKLCDHVIIISNGKIIAQGEMKNVLGNSSLEQLFLELNENE